MEPVLCANWPRSDHGSMLTGQHAQAVVEAQKQSLRAAAAAVEAGMVETLREPVEEAVGARRLWVLGEGEGAGAGAEVVPKVAYHFEDALEERAVSVVTGSGG